MRGYALRQGRILDESVITRAATWSDPQREVRIAKEQALRLIEEATQWTDRVLSPQNLVVITVFPGPSATGNGSSSSIGNHERPQTWRQRGRTGNRGKRTTSAMARPAEFRTMPGAISGAACWRDWYRSEITAHEVPNDHSSGMLVGYRRAVGERAAMVLSNCSVSPPI